MKEEQKLLIRTCVYLQKRALKYKKNHARLLMRTCVKFGSWYSNLRTIYVSFKVVCEFAECSAQM